MRKWVRLVAAIALVSLSGVEALACTDIVAGKNATADGSVITSHTADGAFYDARVRFIPGQKFPAGTNADVFWNITNEEDTPPVKIGEIPQVEQTYGYFHVGYPAMNEHRVAMGESTIGQREELKTFRPDAKAIMTIDQLAVFALQRAKTAREAIQVMGDLAVKYGFLPSCGTEGECLTVTDPDEAWIFNVYGSGFMWLPESGKPGAAWVAQRVPDDEVVVVPNIGRIKVPDENDTKNFMVSKGYKELAADLGLYNLASNKPFSFQEVFAPATGNNDWALSSMWIRSRLYTIYSRLAPSMKWDPYAETSSYPFSVKPEKKISVQDVMDMLRSYHEGSVFDMTEAPAWLVPNAEGKMAKSPLATPFPTKLQRQLLKIPYSRPIAVASCAYSWVSQMRKDLPDPVGGVMWFGFDNPYHTVYVPIYTGTRDTKETWRTFDRNKFDLKSTQWAFILQDDLVNIRWQDTIKDLNAVRGPIEKEFFDKQSEIEKQAVALYKESPAKAEKFLTDYTVAAMEKVENAWWQLNWDTIMKYNNNK